MNKHLLAIVCATASIFFAGYSNAHAIVLQNDKQCSGGTLVTEWGDVQDTGAGIAAKALAGADCSTGFTAQGQCCSVDYHRNIPKAPAIGSHSFWYSIYEGATLITSPAPPDTPTNLYSRWAGLNEPTASAAPLSASLVANPNSILVGENSMLTWSSTGALSCTGTNFSTGGATAGSLVVSPAQTTTYTVTCSGQGGQTTTPPAVINHSEADAYNSPAVIGDMQAHGGLNLPAIQGNTAFSPDQASMDHVCVLIDGAGSVASNIGARNYSSPGNNGVLSYTGGTWIRNGGIKTHMSTSFTCTRSGTTTTTAAPTATASASVSVSSPADPGLQVSCRAHPTQASIGEDVLWSSTVTGPVGSYTYSWTGTDGLVGSTNEVFKKYTAVGHKDASLTVKFTPGLVVNTPPATAGGQPQTPPSTPQLAPTIPPGAICPAIGWVMPVAPCAGLWAPTYTGSCQSGWQCVATGGAGGLIPTLTTPIDTSGGLNINNFIQMFSPTVPTLPQDIQVPQSVDSSVLGASATTIAHTEGDLFTAAPQVKADMLANGGVAFTETTFVGRTLAADQVTMDRVCVDLHGTGATATAIGARGYGSCGNNGIIQFNGSTWASVSGCAGAHLSGSFSCVVPAPTPPAAVACPAGQTRSFSITNLQGAQYCSGGTVVLREVDTQDGASLGGNLQDLLTSTISNVGSGLPDGSCVELSFESGNSVGGGFPPSSHTRIIGMTGGTLVPGDSDFVATYNCLLGFNYACGTMAGLVSSTCQAPAAPPPPSTPNTQTVTVQCENGVHIGTSQCSDGTDNDGDGLNDFPQDHGCTSIDDDDESDTPQCSDGIDNDGDGKIDYGTDPGCLSPDDDDETDHSAPQCSDGIDNDGDGLADAQDPGCKTGSGGSYNPNGTSEAGGNSGAPQCSDGLDNNNDGNVDFPDDPGCSSATDNLEQTEAGDITLAAAPPIIKKGQSCTINLSARNVTSCSLNGPGVSKGYTAQGGIVSATQVVTPALSQTSTFKLSCNGTNGKVTTKSVDCKVAPTFEEF